MPDITALASWQALEACPKTMRLNDLFTNDPARFQRYSIALPGMLADFSKNLVTDKIINLLLSLVEESDLAKARSDFFAGEKVNSTEGRPALHMALRAPAHARMTLDGADVTFTVQKTLLNMQFFANAVRN